MLRAPWAKLRAASCACVCVCVCLWCAQIRWRDAGQGCCCCCWTVAIQCLSPFPAETETTATCRRATTTATQTADCAHGQIALDAAATPLLTLASCRSMFRFTRGAPRSLDKLDAKLTIAGKRALFQLFAVAQSQPQSIDRQRGCAIGVSLNSLSFPSSPSYLSPL